MITYTLKAGLYYPLIEGGYIVMTVDYIGLMIEGLVYHPIDLPDINGVMSTIQNWIIPDPIRESEFYPVRSTDNNRPFHWG